MIKDNVSRNAGTSTDSITEWSYCMHLNLQKYLLKITKWLATKARKKAEKEARNLAESIK